MKLFYVYDVKIFTTCCKLYLRQNIYNMAGDDTESCVFIISSGINFYLLKNIAVYSLRFIQRSEIILLLQYLKEHYSIYSS